MRDQSLNIYNNGQKVADVTTHRAFMPHINAAAKTYELALRPENEDLLTATSHLTLVGRNELSEIPAQDFATVDPVQPDGRLVGIQDRPVQSGNEQGVHDSPLPPR